MIVELCTKRKRKIVNISGQFDMCLFLNQLNYMAESNLISRAIFDDAGNVRVDIQAEDGIEPFVQMLHRCCVSDEEIAKQFRIKNKMLFTKLETLMQKIVDSQKTIQKLSDDDNLTWVIPDSVGNLLSDLLIYVAELNGLEQKLKEETAYPYDVCRMAFLEYFVFVDDVEEFLRDATQFFLRENASDLFVSDDEMDALEDEELAGKM